MWGNQDEEEKEVQKREWIDDVITAQCEKVLVSPLQNSVGFFYYNQRVPITYPLFFTVVTRKRA